MTGVYREYIIVLGNTAIEEKVTVSAWVNLYKIKKVDQ